MIVIKNFEGNRFKLHKLMALPGKDLVMAVVGASQIFKYFHRNNEEPTEMGTFGTDLTLTRPIGYPLHAPVAQKIADMR